MNPRRPVLRPWLLACLIVAAPLLHAQDARTTSMHMQGVDLRAFIQDVSRATGTTFILDSKIQGTVDISRDQAMSNEELLGVLMVVLRGNGLVAVPAGPATYRVVTDDAAAQQPGAAAGGFATEVFALQRIDARAAAESLKPLVGRGGMVVALPQGNKLLLADYADNVRRIRGLVRQIDEDNAAIDTVSLRNTSAQELAGTLREVFGATAGPGAAFNVLPVESSNSLVIRGNPAMVRKVADMAVELDGRAERSGDVAVVRLNHSDAEQLLPVLQQLTGQAVTAPAGGGQGGDAPVAAVATAGVDPANAQVIAPAAGKRPTIVRYPGSNSLILHADPDTRRTLLDVIRQLDVPREQVLVEAIVVEISDGAAKRLGVQLLLGGKDGNIPFAATQWSNSSPGIIPLAGAALARDQDSDLADTLRKAAAESLLGLSGSLFGIGGQSSDLLFGAIIDAVSSDTGSSLLSTPSVLTLDNQEARILVGQEVPVTTGEALSSNYDNAFRTIQRQDVGIQLTVRPQVNSGGSITLAIKQEVSAISGVVSASQELVLNKREVETNVVVQDGAIVVLGGLLDHSDSRQLQKVPGLGDVPGLGALFRSRSRSSTRTNLMVFLRPTLLRSPQDAQRETAWRYQYMRDQQQAGAGSAEAALDALVRDYLRTQPPVAPVPALPAPAAPAPAPVPAPR